MTGSLLPAVKTADLDPQALINDLAAARTTQLKADALHALKLIGGGALLAGAAGRGAVGLMDYLADKPKPKTRPGVLEVGIPVPAPKVAEADLEISPSTLAGVLGGLDGAVTGGLAGGAAGSLGLGGGTLLLNQFRDPKDRRSVLLSALQGLFGGGGLGAIAGGAGGAAGASTATGLLTGELFEEPATEVSPEAAERAGGFPDAGSDEYGTAGGEFGGGSAGQPAKTAAGEEGYFRLGDFASGDLATSIAGIPWFTPAAIGLGLGGAGAGWVGTDRLIAARRKARSEAELEAKRKAFAQALAGDLPPAEPAKVAGVTDPDAEHVKRAGLALDRAFDALAGAVKRANDLAAPAGPTPPAPGGWPAFNNAAGALTGAYGAGALVLAALAASKMYAHQRSRGDRAALDRAVDLHRRLDATGTPLPVYAVPKVANLDPAMAAALGQPPVSVAHRLAALLGGTAGSALGGGLLGGLVGGTGTFVRNRFRDPEERQSLLDGAATGAVGGAAVGGTLGALSGATLKVSHVKQANPDWLTGLVELLKTNPRLAYALLGGGTGGLAGLLGGGSLTHALLGALAGGGLGYGAGMASEGGHLATPAEAYAKGQKAVGAAGSWLERQLAAPEPPDHTLPDGRVIPGRQWAELQKDPAFHKALNQVTTSPEGLRGATVKGLDWAANQLGGPSDGPTAGAVAGATAVGGIGAATVANRTGLTGNLLGVGRPNLGRLPGGAATNLLARNAARDPTLVRAAADQLKLFDKVPAADRGRYYDELFRHLQERRPDAATPIGRTVVPPVPAGQSPTVPAPTPPPAAKPPAPGKPGPGPRVLDTFPGQPGVVVNPHLPPDPDRPLTSPVRQDVPRLPGVAVSEGHLADELARQYRGSLTAAGKTEADLFRVGGRLFRLPGTARLRGGLAGAAALAAPAVGYVVDANRHRDQLQAGGKADVNRLLDAAARPAAP